ncbi:MAG: TraR/DksA family transcriptional regulator [Candidatus Omnitrophota bacterium]
MVSKKNTGKKKAYSKKELESVRKELLQKKARILQEIISLQGDSVNKSLKDVSGDLSGYSFHMADMATDLYDREFSLELAEGERNQLYALDEAIKRIDEGLYGECEACGCTITKQRLQVMPQAKYCIKCQEHQEKSQRR